MLSVSRLLRTPNNVCCIQLDKTCEHKKEKQASDYNWNRKCIIISAKKAEMDILHFITTLRPDMKGVDETLKPIVLIFENR